MKQPDPRFSPQWYRHSLTMSPEMAAAVLAGKKTVTHRMPTRPMQRALAAGSSPASALQLYRHQPGNRIWMRERFQLQPTGEVVYAADSVGAHSQPPGPWAPSIHMPRRLCRAWLLVLGLRLVQLQHVSADALEQEGLTPEPGASLFDVFAGKLEELHGRPVPGNHWLVQVWFVPQPRPKIWPC